MNQFSLKNILLEKKSPPDKVTLQQEKKLSTVVKSEQYSVAIKSLIFEGNGLFRGTNYALFPKAMQKKYQYKTRRKPVDTDRGIDEYLEDYRQTYFPQIPSRQKGLFAVPKRGLEKCWNVETLRIGYGGFKNLIIIPNGANVFQSFAIKDFFESEVHNAIERYLDNEIDYDEQMDDAEESWEQVGFSPEDFDKEAAEEFEERNDFNDYEEKAKKRLAQWTFHDFIENLDKEFEQKWKEKNKNLQLDFFRSPNDAYLKEKDRWTRRKAEYLCKKYKKNNLTKYMEDIFEEEKEEYVEKRRQDLYNDAKEEFIREYKQKAENNETQDPDYLIKKYFINAADSYESIDFRKDNEVVIECDEYYIVSLEFINKRMEYLNLSLSNYISYLYFL